MTDTPPSERPFIWSLRYVGAKVVYWVMSENASYSLGPMMPEAFRALGKDMAEADARGESVEPVLARWVEALEAEADAIYAMRMEQLEAYTDEELME
jgi:hypothetical protein